MSLGPTFACKSGNNKPKIRWLSLLFMSDYPDFSAYGYQVSKIREHLTYAISNYT
ncbi:unknown protein [Microcystis aeruginosa NIES-843]|uniref:Uncharacterized protein n=1 Tax=Microcystis aeruginosa (strain NIES-843 / IAM M-2473) TaxID=449447 RepID=B0JRG7_MICAN|nr:unknown protein [Microcystis aeruginosa NIES-843]